MTTLSDGIANVQSLTAQIDALQRQNGSTKPTTAKAEATILSMQQDFNSMLNTLLDESSSTDERKKNSPLTSFLNEYQATEAALAQQTNAPKTEQPQTTTPTYIQDPSLLEPLF